MGGEMFRCETSFTVRVDPRGPNWAGFGSGVRMGLSLGLFYFFETNHVQVTINNCPRGSSVREAIEAKFRIQSHISHNDILSILDAHNCAIDPESIVKTPVTHSLLGYKFEYRLKSEE